MYEYGPETVSGWCRGRNGHLPKMERRQSFFGMWIIWGQYEIGYNGLRAAQPCLRPIKAPGWISSPPMWIHAKLAAHKQRPITLPGSSRSRSHVCECECECGRESPGL